jgi:hypothetical protein
MFIFWLFNIKNIYFPTLSDSSKGSKKYEGIQIIKLTVTKQKIPTFLNHMLSYTTFCVVVNMVCFPLVWTFSVSFQNSKINIEKILL